MKRLAREVVRFAPSAFSMAFVIVVFGHGTFRFIYGAGVLVFMIAFGITARWVLRKLAPAMFPFMYRRTVQRAVRRPHTIGFTFIDGIAEEDTEPGATLRIRVFIGVLDQPPEPIFDALVLPNWHDEEATTAAVCLTVPGLHNPRYYYAADVRLPCRIEEYDRNAEAQVQLDALGEHLTDDTITTYAGELTKLLRTRHKETP